jgi:hypothetical protein
MSHPVTGVTGSYCLLYSLYRRLYRTWPRLHPRCRCGCGGGGAGAQDEDEKSEVVRDHQGVTHWWAKHEMEERGVAPAMQARPALLLLLSSAPQQLQLPSCQGV